MSIFILLITLSIFPKLKFWLKGTSSVMAQSSGSAGGSSVIILWADAVHTVRRPSRTRWDAFQSSCLFIVLFAGKHGICFDLDALVNANTMLVTLAFIDCDSSQL